MGGKVSRVLEEAHKDQRPNLNLKAQALETFPPVICDHFIWLVKLNLQDNRLTTIPSEIYKLRNLKILQLGGNKLTSAPAELGMLGHLQVLELDNNAITSVHADICNLRNLQELTLFLNQLKELPSSIGKLGSLTKLVVEKNELTSIPVDIGRLVSLQMLNAGDNNIERLPETFGDLKNLSVLSFACNCLLQLPSSFGKLTSLTKLNMRSNMLSSLPSSFSCLTRLTTLAIWDNKFTTFPPEILQLENLTDLSLNANQIPLVPPSIKKLPKLQKLYLQHNFLETLPTEMKYLTVLNVLLLQENKLKNVPCEIGKLPIQHINLDKNFLPPVISKKLQKSHLKLLKYMQKEFEQKKLRLIIVLQRRYRLHLKTRRFTTIVKIIVDTNRQAKLVQQFQLDLKKKQAVVVIQRALRSWLRRKVWRDVVDNAHRQHRRNSFMITLAPPPTSIYVFTAEQINQIKFDEPDSEETITWNDVSEGPSSFSLRRSSSMKKKGDEVPAEPATPVMRSVTIVKLIEKMTNGYTEMQDFWDTVLYTIETFTNASCFLDLLAKRYADASDAADQAVKIRVFEIIRRLVSTHSYYVAHYPLFAAQLHSFISTTLAADFSETSALLLDLDIRRTASDTRTVAGVATLVEFLSSAPKSHSVPSKNFHLCLDVHPEEIARQLALIDHDLLKRVTPLELVNQRWTKSGKDKNAPNVLAVIERFNQVAQWTATEICTEESVKLRVKKIKRFIDIGTSCLEIKNYNGVMQIVTGLNSSAVTRLKTTWASVPVKRKEQFAELEKLMDMYGNYKAYRDALNTASAPFLPFLGLFLSDLTFIDDGNPSYAKKNQINLMKRRLTSEVMAVIARSTSESYRLVPVATIQERLMTCEALDDTTLYKHSLKLERRNTNQGTLRKGLGGLLAKSS